MVNVVEANPGTPGVRSEYTLDRTPIYHDTYACTHTLYCVADQCTSMFLGRWEEMSLISLVSNRSPGVPLKFTFPAITHKY